MSIDKDKLTRMAASITDLFQAIKVKYNRKRPTAYNAENTATVGGRTPEAFDAEMVAPVTNHITAKGDPHNVTAEQVGVFSKQQFDELIRTYFLGSGFPITRIGSLSYHPIAISGDSRGLDITKSSGSDHSRYLEHPLVVIEDDETITYLRNCSNGFERGVYYAYKHKGTYTNSPLITTNAQYKLPDNSNVAYIYQGGQGCFSGKSASATGSIAGQSCFICLHHGNLNNLYHYFVRVSAEFEKVLQSAEVIATATTVYIIAIDEPEKWVRQDHAPRLKYWKIDRTLFTQKGDMVTPQEITFDYQNGFGGRIADYNRNYYQLAGRMVTYDIKDKQGIVTLTDGLMKGGAALLPERIRTYTMYSPDNKFLRTLLVYQIEVTAPNDVKQRFELQLNVIFEIGTNNITLSNKASTLRVSLSNGGITADSALFTINPASALSLVGDENKACGIYLSESDGYVYYSNYRQIGKPESFKYYKPTKTSFYDAIEVPLSLTDKPEKTFQADYRQEGFLCSSPMGMFVFGPNRYLVGLVDTGNTYQYYDINQSFAKTYPKTDAEGNQGEAYPLPDKSTGLSGSTYGDEDTQLCISSVHRNGKFQLNSLYFYKGKFHALGYAFLNQNLAPESGSTLIARTYGKVADDVAAELKYTDRNIHYELVITAEDDLPPYFLIFFTAADNKSTHCRVYEAKVSGKPSVANGVDGERVDFAGLGKLVVDLPDIALPNVGVTAFETELVNRLLGKFSVDFIDGGWFVQWTTRYVGVGNKGQSLLGLGVRFWVKETTHEVESSGVDIINFASGSFRYPSMIPGQGVGYVTTSGNRTVQCFEVIARNRQEIAEWKGVKVRRFLMPQHIGDRWTFYLIEPISVVMTGFSYDIPAQAYSLTSMYKDPADKLLFLYVVIESGAARLDFSEVELDETSDRTFVGTLTTDGRGIEKIDVQKVTRLENYRLSPEPVGSAMSVTTGITNANGSDDVKIRWT